MAKPPMNLDTMMRGTEAAENAQEALAATKPQMSLLHHMAAVQPTGFIGLVVTLLDGTAYKADGVDHIFTDGLSVVVGGHRHYVPLTAIRDIMIHAPGES